MRASKSDTVVKLIKDGADIHMQNKVCLPLTLYDLVRIRCVITQDGDTALILASGHGRTEAVVELLKAGANVNLQNNVCWCCVWICRSVASQDLVLI